MTEDEVFLEFLQNFGDRNRDGKIERAEWNEYYAGVSSSVDNDEHFVQLMKTAWQLDWRLNLSQDSNFENSRFLVK